ncbi:hypothetical protein [Halocatena marina]|uniref:PH domain-containing protein n=1 Tax=Halocatena marina TaxID=2934937 RepID=A0ABD5YWC0_9EURY|nr:hypothetical protein [Halocatena marina]
MRSIEVGAGTVTITAETIQIDLGLFGGLRRLQEQSKLVFPFSIVGLLVTLHTAVFDPTPLRVFARFIIIFIVAGVALGSLLPRIRNNIGTATEIPRTNVKRVEYTRSRLFGLKLRLIVDDGETTGVRPVPLAARQLGKQQLAEAKQTFEDAGITVVPAEDTDDGDG